jgi:hypothetical protein
MRNSLLDICNISRDFVEVPGRTIKAAAKIMCSGDDRKTFAERSSIYIRLTNYYFTLSSSGSLKQQESHRLLVCIHIRLQVRSQIIIFFFKLT